MRFTYKTATLIQKGGLKTRSNKSIETMYGSRKSRCVISENMQHGRGDKRKGKKSDEDDEKERIRGSRMEVVVEEVSDE